MTSQRGHWPLLIHTRYVCTCVGAEDTLHNSESPEEAQDWFTTAQREQLGDRRNDGESNCNCGDGTGQMAQPWMFMMMMTFNVVRPAPRILSLPLYFCKLYAPLLMWQTVRCHNRLDRYMCRHKKVRNSSEYDLLLRVRLCHLHQAMAIFCVFYFLCSVVLPFIRTGCPVLRRDYSQSDHPDAWYSTASASICHYASSWCRSPTLI
jgi:hypothetical protein